MSWIFTNKGYQIKWKKKIKKEKKLAKFSLGFCIFPHQLISLLLCENRIKDFSCIPNVIKNVTSLDISYYS